MPLRNIPSRTIARQFAHRPVFVLALAALALAAAPVTLDAQITITGTVTSLGGGGITNVNIDIAYALGGPSLSLSGDLTGVGGAFAVTILQGPGDTTYTQGGTYTIDFAPPPGHLKDTVDMVLNVPSGGGTQAIGTFPLEQGWVIAGQIVKMTGGVAVGVEGIDIDMRPDGGGGGSFLDLSWDTSGPDGSFSLTMPAATGVYDIFYAPPAPPNPPLGCGVSNPTANPNCALGVFPLETSGTFISLLPGQVHDVGVITMQNAHCVSGTFVNQLGQPLVGFDLQAFDTVTGVPHALLQDDTDCNGFFNTLVPEGTVDLLIRSVALNPPVAYAPVLFESLSVLNPINLGTVTTSPGFSVTGTVTRANGVTAVADAEIDVLDALTGALVYASNDRTNLLGQFDYLVPAGNWLLEVDAPLALVTTVVPQRIPLTVTGTGPVSMGTIILPNGFSISGRCVDDSIPAVPVPFVNVEFVVSSTQAPVDALHENAGAGGNFSAMLVPGTYDVQLIPPPGSNLQLTVVPLVALAANVNLFDIVMPVNQAVQFVRGDVDRNGSVSIGDAIGALQYLFNGFSISCLDSADADDSGSVNIGDAIGILTYLFAGGSPPAAPFPNPGVDPTADPLGCN